MAESYETTLLRLKERAEEKRRHQQEERIKIDAQKAQLLRLLERISSTPGAFDSEDRSFVEAQISANRAKSLKLEGEIKTNEARIKEREELFWCMNAAIDERTRILEEDDACLSEHPEMLQFFARKQVSLQALLQAKIRESCLGFEDELQPQEQRLELGSHP